MSIRWRRIADLGRRACAPRVLAALCLPLILCAWQAPVTLRGTLRVAPSGEPVSNATIAVLPSAVVVRTDRLGQFAVAVAPGSYALHIAHAGFVSRFIDVQVPDRGLSVDVDLIRDPQPLEPVTIRTTKPDHPGTASRAPVEGLRAGDRVIDRADVLSDPTTSMPDALRSLASRPDMLVSPESPTSFRVRGGSADQTTVFVENVPLVFAAHAGGILSPLSADLVSRASVSAGVPSAKFGGALSGIVELQTVENVDRRFRVSGAIGPRAVEQSVNGPIPWIPHSSLLLSARSDRQSLVSLASGEPSDPSFGFSDLFGLAAFRAGRGTVKLFVLVGSERLAFASAVARDTASSSAGGAADAVDAGVADAGSENRFDWTSRTIGATWRGAVGATSTGSVQMWSTRYEAHARWAAARGPLEVASGLGASGLSADFAWGVRTWRSRLGFSLQRFASDYTVRPTGVVSGRIMAPSIAYLSLRAAPFLTAGFFEHSWNPNPALSMVLGARVVMSDGANPALEPRLSVRLQASPTVSVLLGVGRQRQDVQSLRNEESLTDSFLGLSLPAVSAAGLPVATSDQVALTADFRPSPAFDISVDAYARTLAGLALVAPVTGEPFASERVVEGRGRATGIAVQVQRRWRRLFGQVGVGVANVTREADGVSYHPAFSVGQSVIAGLRYRPVSSLVLSTALRALRGRPSTALADDIEWDPNALAQRASELAGSPRPAAGGLDESRLPLYVRLDLGVRRTWCLGPRSGGGSFSLAVDVRNVAGRHNVLGLIRVDSTHTRALAMQPRTVFFSARWHF